MFFSPIALFIIAEILVVFIIVCIFIFYKSRFFKILVALLKEMQLEKRRRKHKEQSEITTLRIKNKNLMAKANGNNIKSIHSEKPFSGQLQERIEKLAKTTHHGDDLTSGIETNTIPHRLQLHLLKLEKALISGKISETKWQELSLKAIAKATNVQQLDNSDSDSENQKEVAEQKRYIQQLEVDLGESSRKLEDSSIRIKQLESSIEDLKSISKPSDSFLKKPERGKYEDTLYDLKCQNFDLQESINQLKLKLQQADHSLDLDGFIGMLEAQILNLENYIKSADTSINLLEKELSAANSEINALEAKLAMAEQPSSNSAIDTRSLTEISDRQTEQSDTVSSMRKTIERLKSGDSSDEVAQEQEAHVSRLEQIIKENEECIKVLESELSRSSGNINQLADELTTQKQALVSERMSNLSDTQRGQKEGLGNIKGLLNEIRQGGDTDSLLTQQEGEVEKLEQFLSESETLIALLEAEITQLNERFESLLQNQTPDDSERIDSNEDMEEMETLLQQFMIDMQSMLRALNKAEDDNKALKLENRQLQEETKEAG